MACARQRIKEQEKQLEIFRGIFSHIYEMISDKEVSDFWAGVDQENTKLAERKRHNDKHRRY